MIANALFLTVAILLAYGFWLLDALKFMAPYKTVLFHAYGRTLLVAVAVLFLNVFWRGARHQSQILLKDTGRKLTHLDRNSRSIRTTPRSRPQKRSCTEMSRDTYSYDPRDARGTSPRRPSRLRQISCGMRAMSVRTEVVASRQQAQHESQLALF